MNCGTRKIDLGNKPWNWWYWNQKSK